MAVRDPSWTLRALGAIWCPTLFHFLFNQRIRRRGKANSITYLFLSSFFFWFSLYELAEPKEIVRSQ